jgi:hypothetical protein
VAARAALAMIAVAVVVWLGVMERDARLQARGIDAAARLHVPGSFERAESDLRGARLLNPDAAPDVSRAALYYGAGRTAQAVQLLEDVVRREPQNRGAWIVLFGFTRDREPAVAERARAALLRLDPLSRRRD